MLKTSFEGNWHLMLPVDPVNMCFLTPHDWKRQHNSALRKSTSIIPVDATHPQNFPQCQGAWPSHVQGVYGWELSGDMVGQVTWNPSERASSVMEQFTKMNVRSAHIKRDYLCFKSLRSVSFEEVLFFFTITSLHRLHHTSPFHFSFHFLLFLWVYFCLVGLCKDPRG